MTTYLADSSVWIDFLQRPAARLNGFIRDEEVAHSEPVMMEVLSGARERAEIERVQRMLLGTPLLQFDSASDFGAATELRRSALSQRLRVGLVDCMILAVAGRHGVPLLTLDRGQAALAQSHGIPVTLPVD
ncbi:MAG: PIN domain-containing protein [Candidatus Nanopelagicales bacterium]